MANQQPPPDGRQAQCPRWRLVNRFCRDAGGHALVEAALVVPILAGLFLGISEFSEAFTVSRRLERAAGASADLVARVPSVTTAELAQIKPMLDEMIRPYPTTSFGLVVTSVVADDSNTTTVAWSYAAGSGVSPRSAGAPITVPSGLTDPGKSVIFSEVGYTFRSTLATLITGGVPLAAEAYVRPRLAAQVVKLD